MNIFLAFFKNLLHNMLQIFSFGRKTITNTLSVCIKTNTGNTINVDLDPKWHIGNVKQLVADELGLRADELKIIFAGKELSNNTLIEECDLGQRSILHAVKTRHTELTPAALEKRSLNAEDVIEEEDEGADDANSSKPLSSTLVDLQLENLDRLNISETERERTKAHFFVHCSQCKELCAGKLRVRCAVCKGGAFTVYRDPENWDDVLKSRRIQGHCENNAEPCVDDPSAGTPPFAEFYFKCSKHASGGEKDFSAPLNLIKINIRNVPCLACTDICETVLVFPCTAGHVTCLPCFRQYCESRLMERQFISHEDIGYTLACPARCDNSFIREIHHFKLLTAEQYERYQRFATEEFVLRSGGVLCPRPGCGMGLLVDEECNRVTCVQGCGFVFCRLCLKGYHLGDCVPDDEASSRENGNSDYSVDPERAATARWDEASQLTIKVITKPCPKCRTPTERSGGCMHMVCTRSGCGFEWCWVCQVEWTRDCMGTHWFG